MAPLLAPRQLGVGTPGGAEAIVHATWTFLYSASSQQILLKLDFANAFNSVRQNSILEAVALELPQLLLYVSASYESPSSLVFGGFILDFAEGIQQGDPLGPILFSMAISKVLLLLQSEFTAAYLDDVALGGTIESLEVKLTRFEKHANSVGLTLNFAARNRRAPACG